MTDVFSAIDDLNVQAVRDYLDNGGDASVRSSKGFSLLSYVVLKFLQPVDDYDDGACDSDQDLSDDKKKLVEIGSLLLQQGADYDQRLGKTKMSIKISERLKTSFPDVHRDWYALHQRNKMLGNDVVNSAVEDHSAAKPRKI